MYATAAPRVSRSSAAIYLVVCIPLQMTDIKSNSYSAVHLISEVHNTWEVDFRDWPPAVVRILRMVFSGAAHGAFVFVVQTVTHTVGDRDS